MSRVTRRPLYAAAVAVAVLFNPEARAADEPKDVIAKAIKAHGGEDALTKNKAAQTKTKGKITLPMVGETDFTQQVSSMLPDKLREEMELSVGGNTLTVLTLVNGDDITIELNGKAMEVPDAAKAAVKDARHVSAVARLVPLKDAKTYELSLIGDDKVEGKKVVGVLVKSKGRKDVSVYFDKETGLLAKMEFRGTDTGGNEVTEERIVTEYAKLKGGTLYPKKVLVKHDGKTFIDAEVTEVEYLEKLDDSVFKK